ncbi:MAG: asparaginase domain-containing protein [Dysosmobacter welbionis]
MVEIAACIRDHYGCYDGFVITHGTDTMVYTAAALSYLIQGSPKPIVLTGAQRPIDLILRIQDKSGGRPSLRGETAASLYRSTAGDPVTAKKTRPRASRPFPHQSPELASCGRRCGTSAGRREASVFYAA